MMRLLVSLIALILILAIAIAVATDSEWRSGTSVVIHPTVDTRADAVDSATKVTVITSLRDLAPEAAAAMEFAKITIEPAKELNDLLAHDVGLAVLAYPRSIGAVIHEVYLVDRLFIDGVPVGGTYYGHRVFCSLRAPDDRFVHASWLQSVAHAEISSVYFHKHASCLPSDRWQALNLKGFRYHGSGLEVARIGGPATMYDSALWAEGFLTDYAKASLEEDFNACWQFIMTADEQSLRRACGFSILKNKFELTCQFAYCVDSNLGAVLCRKLACCELLCCTDPPG